jgi:N-acetylmuramoyl-L-alanine amidase
MRLEDRKTFYALDPAKAMALTVYLEARGEPKEGQEAVAWVIMNRANHPSWMGKDVVSVCFQPKQFSGYNDDNPEYPLALRIASDFENQCKHDASLMECYEVSCSVLSGAVMNPFGRPDVFYYHTLTSHPSWDSAYKEVAVIGNHKFLC